MKIRIIGGGLAGSEAALTAARLGCTVDLYEMRREEAGELHLSPAHETTALAELVCSNSLKSESPNTAPWLLKQEMRRAQSALMALADETAVPAGHALAVDRVLFAERVTQTIAAEPRITLHREEVTSLADDPEAVVTILASGPLTSEALSRSLAELTGTDGLAFFDSIAPIVEADSINLDKAYFAARWDKGGADYLNCPMEREEYDIFYEALLAAESAGGHDWDKAEYFEGCLPIEVLASRGRDTLRYGPMKPVGLRNPRTGKTPWAVVQLRKENQRADSYNLVGFQNHLKFGDQARVLKLIPGLEDAHFLRFGQIHRNTYICAPKLIDSTLRLKEKSGQPLLFAGQLSGIEGYTESIATGLLAGIHAAQIAQGRQAIAAPRTSGLGSLVHYITAADAKDFQPANMTFDLLEPLEEELRKKIRDKKERHRLQCERSLAAFDAWWAEINLKEIVQK